MWMLDILFITIIFLVILAMVIDIFWEKTAAILLLWWLFFLILSPVQFVMLAIVGTLGGWIVAKN